MVRAMYLIEILLPCADNGGTPFPLARFADVRKTLTRQFGGVTAFTRAPAHGVFHNGSQEVHDDIIVLEVMAETLDREMWARYRKHLEREFDQDEILIRASSVEKL
jgi:hypothetical protein